VGSEEKKLSCKGPLTKERGALHVRGQISSSKAGGLVVRCATSMQRGARSDEEPAPASNLPPGVTLVKIQCGKFREAVARKILRSKKKC